MGSFGGPFQKSRNYPDRMDGIETGQPNCVQCTGGTLSAVLTSAGLTQVLKIRQLHVGPESALNQARYRKEVAMLYYALVFLVVALIAGVLGFGGVAFASAEIAKICFFVFLVLFVVSLISHLSRRGAA